MRKKQSSQRKAGIDDPDKVMSLKIGVYSTHDDPDVWTEFDPEDIMDLAMVQDNGWNYMFLTIQRAGNMLPIWKDYAEFFDVAVGMCGNTDFLAGIQALKQVKEHRFKALAAAQQSLFRSKNTTGTDEDSHDLPN